MMGYDRAIVTFSPDGRLFQVEYAREAVKRGTTIIGLIFDQGVILTASKPSTPLAIPEMGGEKISQLDDHLGAAISGFMADGRVLVERSRVRAQVYKLTYDEPLDVLGAVKEISDIMQAYTQYGGVRPFGVALLLGGVDERGARLFEIDPSSTFYGWKAHAIGRGAPEALKILRKEWKEKMKQEDAMKLAIKSLKAAEKNVKLQEVELAIVTANAYKKIYGNGDSKQIKKIW
jgi:proteasome alpha subunit